ncbi:UvrD-helicase domain-containing protein, partial [Acinetobacter baumannii]
MKKDQVFDFTLLERLAVDLLTKNSDVQSQTKAQYPVVLVDESQDVNPVQFSLLNALDPANHVMVGDPQQSIYGFRLADRELFLSRINEPGVSTFWL